MSADDVVTLELRRVRFFSQNDEAALFEWLAKLGLEPIGRGDALLVKVARAIPDETLRELIGLFARYDVSMEQLSALRDDELRPWFSAPGAFWFEKIFGVEVMPEKYRRYPTEEAIDSLAARFGFPNDPYMQDWQWVVADAARLPELLRALERDSFTDDERYVLAEIVMQCFEDRAASGVSLSATPEWGRFIGLLRSRPEIHAGTVWYWSAFGSELNDAWGVAPLMRLLWIEIQPTLR